jgi:hypothetical protein
LIAIKQCFFYKNTMAKIVDIKIIKGRRQEDMNMEVEMRLKIRAIAEAEYKIYCETNAHPLMSINAWVHTDSPNNRYTNKWALLRYLRDEYDTLDQMKARYLYGYEGLQYNKTPGAPLRLIADEVSIEQQILRMMYEGWVTKGEISASGAEFFQTMVLYENV